MTDKTATGHSDTQSRTTYVLNLFCLLFTIMILLLDLSIPLGVAIGVLYIFPILLSLWSQGKGFTVFVAVVSSAFVIGVFFYQPPVAEMWKVLFNRALSLFAILITATLGLQRMKIAIEREQALRDREKTLENLKILGGLLPICASCKKIRDDEGYWNDVAVYITDNSEAEFTHGICPECAEKLYPGYCKKSEQGKDKT